MKGIGIGIILGLFILTGCGSEKISNDSAVTDKIDLSQSKNGTYTAESSRDDKLGYGRLTLTIKDHKITDAEFIGVDLFGEDKGENYGSIFGKDSADYKKAQIAVQANKNYAEQLVETQSLEKVDAISGATISYNQFAETAKIAIANSAK